MTQIVKMKGMNKYFGKLHVLKDIDLTVEQGEVVVIIGASGSGKSTLIRCVNGLEEYESGTLEVDGQQLAPKSGNPKALAEIRKEVGMVFQQFNLFPHLTVKRNIMLAPKKVKDAPETVANATAERLLNRVGIGNQADKYPSQLSGGQQQRVAIARALAMEPRLMLFDEPHLKAKDRFDAGFFGFQLKVNSPEHIVFICERDGVHAKRTHALEKILKVHSTIKEAILTVRM